MLVCVPWPLALVFLEESQIFEWEDNKMEIVRSSVCSCLLPGIRNR